MTQRSHPTAAPQGPGRIAHDQNEPKLAPKLAGVGFWHALARWGQVCTRPVRGCWEQKELSGDGGRGFTHYKTSESITVHALAAVRRVSKLILRLTVSDPYVARLWCMAYTRSLACLQDRIFAWHAA